MAKTFQGKSVSSPTEDNRLFSPAKPQFIYMHHPNTWDLMKTDDQGGYELLPALTKFQLIAGLNGVKHRPGGGIDSTAARASFLDRGWIFIDNKKGGEGGYLREFEGLQGRIYQDKWTTPRKLGGGIRARVVWDCDLEGYNAFRRSLMEDGTIPAPDESALDWKIELAEKRINRKIKDSHIPKVAQKMEEAQEEKEALIEAKATKTTKPKTKKKTKAKKAE